MGIQSLLPFLANSTRDAHISEFENEFVAIDAYCWLHKGIYSCAFELAMKKPTKKYVTYCMRYIEMLQHFKVKPILVFDGRHLASKSETEKKRRDDRKKNYEKGKELIRAEKHIEGRRLLGLSVDITHSLALNLIKECREKNIDCIVASYEADAQLAFLSLKNIVKCIVTEDSDLLAYGSERVMFKMDTSGRGRLIEKCVLHKSLGMTPEEFNDDLFRYMCILSGCDYLPSLPSIGPANALKFVKMLKGNNIFDALPKLPIYVNKMNVKVPLEYISGFRVADNTFKHQLVYDPFLRTQVPLQPVSNDDEIVGTKLPDDLAFQLAIGNIDPIKMKEVDNYDPDKVGKGFSILWKTDLLPNAVARHSTSICDQVIEHKKRQREIVECDAVQSLTSYLKKPCTSFNSFRKFTPNSVRKFTDSGFIFSPKISNEKKSILKVSDESAVLKSRYFFCTKDKGQETKQCESMNGRRKDESYDDYLQRLYNEYFPLDETESEEKVKKNAFCGTQSKSLNFCSSCREDRDCCICTEEIADASESQKLGECIRNFEEKNKEKSEHCLLDEIYKTEAENSVLLCDDHKKEKEKSSSSQNLSLNFSKVLSDITENPKTEVAEKENFEVVYAEEAEGKFVRSPSPVFKVQKHAKILHRNYSLGNFTDTAGTPTSIYFSSFESEKLNETIPQDTSRQTPFITRKMPSVKSFSSVPAKVGKNQTQTSSVNKTLFQFGFKRQRKDESDPQAWQKTAGIGRKIESAS